ncbi:MAG: TetR/AcrR family transcriptional regulator, partial [Steroidobacteraceae bacterium]
MRKTARQEPATSAAHVRPNRLRRLPSQSRGHARLQQILDTGAAALREVGYDATTVQLIASRARLHVGSIYHFFPDRIAIFATLLSRVDDEIDRQIERLNNSLPSGVSPDEWSHAFVRALDLIWRETEHLAEAYQALQRNPVIQKQNTVRYQGIIGRIATGLERWMPARSASERRRTAFLLYAAASGTLDDA